MIAIYVSDLAFLAVLVVWLVTTPWRRFFPRAVVGLLAAFAAWAMIRGALSDLPHLGLYHGARVLQGVFFALIAADVVRQRYAPRVLLGVLVFVGVLQSLLGVTQVWRGAAVGLQVLGEPAVRLELPGVAKVDIPGGQKVLRAYGTLPHPNVLSGVLLATLVATVVLSLAEKRVWMRWTYALAMSAQLLGLLLTFSRTALLSLILALISLCVIKYNKIRYSQLLAVFTSSALVLFFIFIVSSPIRSAVLSRFIPPPSDMFLSDRYVSYRLAWDIVRKHPFIGVGTGEYVFSLWRSVPHGTQLLPWLYEYPHNVLLTILVELGIIGILFPVLILISLRPHTKDERNSILMFLALLAPPLMLDHYLWTLQPGRIILWSTLGIVLGIKIFQNTSMTGLAHSQ